MIRQGVTFMGFCIISQELKNVRNIKYLLSVEYVNY